MTRPAQGKIIFFSAALFIAGGICGAMLLRHFSPPANQPLKVGRTDEINRLITAKMKAKLDLTPSQLNQLAPMITNTAAQLEAIHVECLKNIAATVDRLHVEVTGLLTPEQKEKMVQMEAERRETWKQKYNYNLEATNSAKR